MAGKQQNNGTTGDALMVNEKKGKALKTKFAQAPQAGGAHQEGKAPQTDEKKARESSSMDQSIEDAQHKAITHGLRKFFDNVAAEPIPDEFLVLLKKMDDNEEDK